MKYGISPNLKIAEDTEIEILKQETLEDLFETKYEEEDKEFIKTVNMYTSYKKDDALKEVILGIYDFIQSMPYPEKWLEEKIELFNIKEENFEDTIWGKILFKKAKNELQDVIYSLSSEMDRIKYEEDTEKFVVTLSEDIRRINEVKECKTWDEMYEKSKACSLDKLPTEKKVPDEIKNRIKKVRDKARKTKAKVSDSILMYTSKEAITDIKKMYNIMENIRKLTIEFSDNFRKVKQDRNIMDFSDIEHYALEILSKDHIDSKTQEEVAEENIEENAESKMAQNYVAKKYIDKYEEILIDEYQDSNLVQEKILTSISKGNNIFMVGDVKQSIYKFRQARPELFLEKYETYSTKEELKEGQNLKIQLFKNFRSRKNILNLTNTIFDAIMSKELGDIDYTEEEYLNLGAEYDEGENLKAELNIIDLKAEESIYKTEESEEAEEEKIEDVVLEAKFVASKIKELIDSGFEVYGKDKKKRKVKYKDIAILLRSTKTTAPIYEQEISKLNIPVFSDTASRLFGFGRDTSNDEFIKNNR